MKLKKIGLLASVVLSIAAASSANAAGITDLTSAISFTDVIAAIFSVGVLIIGVDLALLGFHKVRSIAKAGK